MGNRPYGAGRSIASGRTGGSGLGPSEQGQGGVVTLRQRGMPFDGGWVADNALGDVNTPEVALARFQRGSTSPPARFKACRRTGADPRDCRWLRGGGRPGVYDGIEFPTSGPWTGKPHRSARQWSPAEHWTVGGQLIDAHKANLAVGPVIDGSALQSSGTGLMSAAWG